MVYLLADPLELAIEERFGFYQINQTEVRQHRLPETQEEREEFIKQTLETNSQRVDQGLAKTLTKESARSNEPYQPNFEGIRKIF